MPDTRPRNVRPPRHSRPATDTPAIAAKAAAPRPRRTRSIASLRHEWEPYLFIDQLRLMPQGGEPGPGLRLLTAITVATDGRPTTRFLLPLRESHAESWVRMLAQLRRERLPDLRLIVADGSPALRAATLRAFPRVQWQQSIPAFCARVLAQTPQAHREGIARRLHDIYQQPDRTSATGRAIGVAALLARLGHWAGAVYFAASYQDTLTYYSFPERDWQQLREQVTGSDLRGTIRRQLALDGRDDGWLVERENSLSETDHPGIAASPDAPGAATGHAGGKTTCLPTPELPSAATAVPPPAMPDSDPGRPPEHSPERDRRSCESASSGARAAPADAATAGVAATPAPTRETLAAGTNVAARGQPRHSMVRVEIIEVEDRYGYTALFRDEARTAAVAAAGRAARASHTPASRLKGRLKRVAGIMLGTVGANAFARADALLNKPLSGSAVSLAREGDSPVPARPR